MTSALRKKILSLAIRGKLVPQDPSDEPASVLLERIRAERAANEAGTPPRGRGRRSSSDNPPCPKRGTESGTAGVADPPFPIPESWAWTTLGEILIAPPRNGFSPKPANHPTRTKRLTLSATTSGTFKQDEFRYVEEVIPPDSYLWLKPGNLLIQRSNSMEHIGTSCVYTGKPNDFIYPDLMMKLLIPEQISVNYIDVVLKTPEALRYFQEKATGSAGSMPKINKETVSSFPIPLPPLAEQKRIVDRLDELQVLCNDIDEDNEVLRDLATKAKARILDLAIRGALVPQDPSDEPAAELLSRIRATADKPPCPKQPPFDIPATWEWTTLESIGEVIRGSGIKRSEISTSGKPCIRYGEIYTTYYLKTKSVASSIPPALFNASKHASPRSILMTLTGEDRKDIAKTIAYLGEEEIAISGDMLCVCPREVEPLYLSFVLNSPWAIERKGRLATGDLVIHISAKTMSEFLIPLPPLAEQRRIVAKVEELFAAIDRALG